MINRLLSRKLYRTSVTWFVFALFFGIVANLPRESVRLRYWSVAESSAGSDVKREVLSNVGNVGFEGWSEPESLGRFVGWPIAVPIGKQGLGVVSVNASTLIVNAVVVAALAGLAAVMGTLLQLLSLMLRQAARNDRRPTSLHFLTTVACITLVTGGILMVSMRKSNVNHQFRREINQFGSLGLSVCLTGMLAQQIPKTCLFPFLRIEAVRLHSPDRRLFEKLLNEVPVSSISLSSYPIDKNTWTRLVESSDLSSLTFVNCEFEFEVVRDFAKSARLQSLAFHHCKNVERVLQSIGGLSTLSSLKITGNPVRFHPDLIASLPRGIQELSASLEPQDAIPFSFVAMSRLESLSLQWPEQEGLEEPVCLELSQLPMLTVLRLPAVRPINLTIDSLPRLASIRASRWQNRDDVAGFRNRPLPVAGLRIDSAPSLIELNLDPSVLRSLRITNTPNLRTLTVAMPDREARLGASEIGAKSTRKQPNVETTERWMRDIALCDGPGCLSLRGVSLKGVDLSPLQQNMRIRELNLSDTSVSAEQVVSMRSGERIEVLDMKGCEIESHGLQSILAAFPLVKRLDLDTSRLKRIDVIDRPELKQLLAPVPTHATHIVIAGSPNLSGHLMLGRHVKQLNLREAASLQTLSVLGPLPSETVLHGLRDLEIVELGGENVTDEVFSSLLSCPSLIELTLAAPRISAPLLRSIGRFSHLQRVRLPGSNVNDDVISHWDGLVHLREIDLSYTDITHKSLEDLVVNQGIQKLLLNHTKLHADDLSPIVELPYLLELEVAGVGLSPAILRHCVVAKLVERLDLSDSVVTAEMVDVLASGQANHLMFLGLKRCGLSEDSLRRIAEANPRLAMDITGNEANELFVEELRKSGRIISRDDRHAFDQWVACSPVQPDVFGDQTPSRDYPKHSDRHSRDWFPTAKHWVYKRDFRHAILRNFSASRRTM